ncbi:MAG TPA: alginate export family protein, partial [Tepidisphaeraceae bacterium]|nr:alginate export family protein [Tepidisphaeraceae bacterium]
MRLAFVTLLIALPLLPAAAHAQDYAASGPYSIVRWDEDYSYLKDPAKRTDFFDPVKYIPIGDSPDAYISFGGQIRDRFDYFNNNEFAGGPRDTGFNLIRLLAHADVHFNSHIRGFLQLISALEDGRAGGPRTGDADDFDIQQAFVDLSFAFGDNADYGSSIVLRVGRQELIYGAQRLLSPNDWRNVRQSFDGVKASVYLPNDTLDVFLTRPVLINKTHLNSSDDHTYFGGIYNVTELPRVLPEAHSKLDLYLLALNKIKSATTAVDSNTYTLGARFHTTPLPWDFDFEPDWQFGTTAGNQIAAWAIAGEAGYTFQSVPLTPRLAIGADIASGSVDAAHRFNQLFP